MKAPEKKAKKANTSTRWIISAAKVWPYAMIETMAQNEAGASVSGVTAVRVLKCGIKVSAFVYNGLMQQGGCERLEVFMQFSPSTFFAKLPGCTPENSFSPNSPT